VSSPITGSICRAIDPEKTDDNHCQTFDRQDPNGGQTSAWCRFQPGLTDGISRVVRFRSSVETAL